MKLADLGNTASHHLKNYFVLIFRAGSIIGQIITLTSVARMVKLQRVRVKKISKEV